MEFNPVEVLSLEEMKKIKDILDDKIKEKETEFLSSIGITTSYSNGVNKSLLTIVNEMSEILKKIEAKETRKELVLNKWQKNMFDAFSNVLFNKHISIDGNEPNINFVVNSNLRQLGQSLLCLYMSDKFECPILVNSRARKKLMSKEAKIYGLKYEIFVYDEFFCFGGRNVYILDGLHYNDYENIKNIYPCNLIGFIK